MVKHNPIHETMIALGAACARPRAPARARPGPHMPRGCCHESTCICARLHRMASTFFVSSTTSSAHDSLYTRLVYTVPADPAEGGSSRPHTDTPHTRRQNVQYTRNTLAITQWSKAQSHERHRTLDHRTATRSLPEPLYGIQCVKIFSKECRLRSRQCVAVIVAAIATAHAARA